MGQFTALHFLMQKQNRCKVILTAKVLLTTRPCKLKTFQPEPGQLPPKWRAAAQFGRIFLMTTVGVFIRTIQQHLRGPWNCVKCWFKIISFVLLLLCMAYLLLRLLRSKCLCASSTLCCMFLIFLQFRTMQRQEAIMVSDLKQEAHTGRNFWLIEIMNNSVCQS